MVQYKKRKNTQTGRRNEGENTMRTINADSKTVKYLGRTLYQDGVLWLALSGSGIEFDYSGTDLLVTVLGDDNVVSGVEQARIAIYIDDTRVIDEMIVTPQKTYSVIENGVAAGNSLSGENLADTKHCIRIIKLTEAPMSVFGIKELLVNNDASLNPTADKALKLEFIGDSITCGYGVDDEDLSHAFSTKTEDVTKAYAYLAARTLDADYSMVSYSGHGVYSGYTEGDERYVDELVPPYYPLVGYSRGTVNGKRVTAVDWNFSSYVPELIVINLGTNDDSYCRDVPKRQEEFVIYYKNFLKLVHEKNPNAYLLCTYGLMNTRLTPFIEKAVSLYTEETAHSRISFLPLPMQTEADGYVVDYHPHPDTHKKAAKIVSDRIREILQNEKNKRS